MFFIFVDRKIKDFHDMKTIHRRLLWFLWLILFHTAFLLFISNSKLQNVTCYWLRAFCDKRILAIECNVLSLVLGENSLSLHMLFVHIRTIIMQMCKAIRVSNLFHQNDSNVTRLKTKIRIVPVIS